MLQKRYIQITTILTLFVKMFGFYVNCEYIDISIARIQYSDSFLKIR